MKRVLIVWVLLLAFGLQGSLSAFAAMDPAMQDSCDTSADQSHTTHGHCCPGGTHSQGCCLDGCVVPTAISGASFPSLPRRAGRALTPPFLSSTFSSRGHSPLTRPPIL